MWPDTEAGRQRSREQCEVCISMDGQISQIRKALALGDRLYNGRILGRLQQDGCDMSLRVDTSKGRFTFFDDRGKCVAHSNTRLVRARSS